MSTMLLFSLGTAIGLISPIVIYKIGQREKKPARPKQPKSAARKNPYAAVVIRVDVECCQAAHEIRRQLFLEDYAPALPLAGCNLEQCKCRYQHRTDRRGSEDRRFELHNELTQQFLAKEHRSKNDRRQSADSETEDAAPRSKAYFNDFG